MLENVYVGARVNLGLWTCYARACVKYWLYLVDSRAPTLLQSELTEPLLRFLRISFFVYHKSLSNEPRVIHCALIDDRISVREIPSYVPPQRFAFKRDPLLIVSHVFSEKAEDTQLQSHQVFSDVAMLLF